MRQDDKQETQGGLAQYRVVWGTSLVAGSLIFSILLLIILIFGHVSVRTAFGWAAGAGLVTLVIVALTGLSFYRLPLRSQRRDLNRK